MVDTATTKIYCKTCKRRLFNHQPYCTCYHSTPSGEIEISHYLCDGCSNDERIGEYRKNGEISSRLWLDATMMKSRLQYDENFEGLRWDVKDFYSKYKSDLLRIDTEMEEVQDAMKDFEKKHWIPWLCDFYKNESGGFSHIENGAKILLMGCGGRVLITIQDQFPQGSPESKFGGAWITLIFADGDKSGNGGIQGLCATKVEAIGLLLTAMKTLNEGCFKKDSEVSIL